MAAVGIHRQRGEARKCWILISGASTLGVCRPDYGRMRIARSSRQKLEVYVVVKCCLFRGVLLGGGAARAGNLVKKIRTQGG